MSQDSSTRVDARPAGALDRFFSITARGSSVGREVRGGLATFFAMAYIVVLNPIIIGSATDSTGKYLGGGDSPNLAAVAAATALISGIFTIVMGVIGNFPLAVSSSLGMSAFVTYGVVVIPGMTWADAMGLVVIEGVILLILVLTGFRRAIFNSVPEGLKSAISVGIGLFIALIGMIDAGFVRKGSGSGLELGQGGFVSGWPVLVFIVALLALFVLWSAKVRGAILYSILGATVLALILQSTMNIGPKTGDDGKVVNPNGWGLTVPSLDQKWLTAPDFSTLGQFNLLGSFQHVGVIVAVLTIFTLLLTNFFDLLGTMVGVANTGKLIDANGEIPGSQRIMVADALGAIGGGLGATSSNSAFVESTVGVSDGARTGLSSITVGVLFLVSVVLSPLAAVIPTEAAAPTLVLVGFLMMQQIVRIDWSDIELGIPAFMTIALMPFSYSITNGIGAGFITFVVIKLSRGKGREVHPLMYLTAVLFAFYFVAGPVQALLES